MKLSTPSFRGMAPRLTPRLLPENGSQEAINAQLLTGNLMAWHRPGFVYQVPCAVPSFSISVSVDEGVVPLSVDFTLTDLLVGEGPFTYAWDFGDGATSTEQNPTHEYTTAGLYTPTVTITSECGSSQLSADIVAYDAVLTTPGLTPVQVPPGVTTLYVVLKGPGGGASLSGPSTAPLPGTRVGYRGGAGGKVIARFSVTPGELMDFVTGGAGQSGRNDAGSPFTGYPVNFPTASSQASAGAGGAMTSIRRNPSFALLAVAGGGGGGGCVVSGGYGSAGGAGGPNGISPDDPTNSDGDPTNLPAFVVPGGGTQVAGGAGGAVPPATPNVNGGGAGAFIPSGGGSSTGGAPDAGGGGGSGGGGYYGGGGGFAAYSAGGFTPYNQGCGGAGGSNYVAGIALETIENSAGTGGAGGETFTVGAGDGDGTNGPGEDGSIAYIWNG
jgi:PKD repeat protein